MRSNCQIELIDQIGTSVFDTLEKLAQRSVFFTKGCLKAMILCLVDSRGEENDICRSVEVTERVFDALCTQFESPCAGKFGNLGGKRVHSVDYLLTGTVVGPEKLDGIKCDPCFVLGGIVEIILPRLQDVFQCLNDFGHFLVGCVDNQLMVAFIEFGCQVEHVLRYQFAHHMTNLPNILG